MAGGSWLDYHSKNGAKFYGIIILFVVLIALPLGLGKGPLWLNAISGAFSNTATIISTACAFGATIPSGCNNTPVTLKATLQDQYGTTSFGSSWFARVFCAGSAPSGATGPCVGTTAGTIAESSITSSGGAITTGNAYTPGTPLVFEISSGSGFTYTTTSDIYYTPTVTVPYCPATNGCQTSTTYVPMSIIFTLNPGKNVGANANTITATFPNATSVTTTETAFCKSGSNSLGQQFQIGFSVQTGTTGSLPTAPFGVGYTSFTPLDLNAPLVGGTSARGQLITAVQVEIKETSSTGNTINTISGPLTKLVSKPASVSDIIYYVPLNDAVATLGKGSGNVILGSSTVPGDTNAGPNGTPLTGLFQYSESFDCTQVYNGSSVVVTVTSIEYMNYSPTYVAANNGGLNPEAAVVSGSSNNVLTFKT